MWQTVEGERKVARNERALFVAGVVQLHETLSSDPGFETGVSMFDQMPEALRPWTLLWVARALCGDDDAPELDAWNESTVYTVFRHIDDQVGQEIRRSSRSRKVRTSWRRLVKEAWMQDYDPKVMEDVPFRREEGPNQPLTSRDHAQWGDKIERLADRILWDRDFEMQEMFLDSRPDVSDAVKEHVGIHKEYFFRSMPELDEEERRALTEVLKSISSEGAQLDA